MRKLRVWKARLAAESTSTGYGPKGRPTPRRQPRLLSDVRFGRRDWPTPPVRDSKLELTTRPEGQPNGSHQLRGG